ncbi:MAG: GNAT family N-acetyltransferase [Chloroflexota bacterium]
MFKEKYLIRDAIPSDIPSLVDFGVRVGEDTYLKTGFLPAAYVRGPQRTYWTAEYLQGVIEGDKSLLLVVFDGESLIGMTEVERLSPDEAVMWKLYVQHADHGEGIGSRLLDEIIERLPSDVRWLKTEYYDSNISAAQFYKAKGFAFLERKLEQFGKHAISYTYVSIPLERKL